MGTVFGFVSKDLKAKMDLLNEYLNSTDHSEYFKSVKKMIEYEKEKELLSNKDHVSGARTLLRLHRGLGIAIIIFLNIFLAQPCS